MTIFRGRPSGKFFIVPGDLGLGHLRLDFLHGGDGTLQFSGVPHQLYQYRRHYFHGGGFHRRYHLSHWHHFQLPYQLRGQRWRRDSRRSKNTQWVLSQHCKLKAVIFQFCPSNQVIIYDRALPLMSWLASRTMRLTFLTWRASRPLTIHWLCLPLPGKMYRIRWRLGSNPCPPARLTATFSPFSRWAHPFSLWHFFRN